MYAISPRPCARRSARAHVAKSVFIEPLEDRIAPALHKWIGPATGGLWSNAANWQGGVPTTGEGGGTVVEFDGGVSSTDNLAGLVIGEIHFTAGGNSILGGAGVTLGIDASTVLNNLVNDTGTNTIDSTLPIVISSATLFAQIPAGRLVLKSNISGSQGFTMNDGSFGGIIQFAADNTYTGTTTVRDGTLELNSPGPKAVPGDLTIGNNSGSEASAVVRLLQSAEIADTSNLIVASEGWFDMGLHNETVASLQVTSGTTFGSLVGPGSSSNSLALAAGGIITLTFSGTGAAPATIGGFLNLSAGTHTILVNDGGSSSDLVIVAGISGSFTKTGPGTLELAPAVANAFTAPITVGDGTLLLDSGVANGAINGDLIIGDGVGNTSSAVVQVNAVNQIADTSAVTIHTDGRLFLNNVDDDIGSLSLDSGTTGAAAVSTGTGTLGLGGDLTTTTTGTGAVAPSVLGHLDFGNLLRDIITADGAASTDLLLGATVAAANGYIKAGPGTLETVAAGPAGTIQVHSGTLLLNSSGPSDAAPGGLNIGTDAGVTATVRMLHDSELGPTVQVAMHSDGVLDLNNHSDSVGGLTLVSGDTVGAKITTGTGTLNVMGLTVTEFLGTGAVAPSISGQVDFHGNTIAVADGAASTDLLVTAKITGTSGYTKGGGILGTGAMEVRASGPTGIVTVANGTLLLNSNGNSDAIQGPLFIGSPDGAGTGTVKLLQVGEIGDVTVTLNSTGTLDCNNFNESIGSLAFQDGGSAGGTVLTGTAVLTISGGISTFVLGTGAGVPRIAGPISLPAGDHEFNIADGAASVDLIILATIAGAGALTKSGAGSLVIFNGPGDNTYAGVTAIHDGVLVLSSQQSADSTSDQIIIGDALGGPGTAVLRLGFDSVIQNTATVTVAADGLLDFNNHSDAMGALSLLAHGTIHLANGTATTANFSAAAESTLSFGDQGKVAATGTVTLGGFLAQDFATNPTPGVPRTIIDNDGTDAVVGTFAGLPEGAVFGTSTGLFQISYVGGTGNDVTVTAVDAEGVVQIAANGKSATFTDVDGDLVTVKTTKGVLTKDNFQLGGLGSGLVNGYQLQGLLLNQAQYDGAVVTITAKPTALGGNGHVNVGTIDATGHDLASVTVAGDVSRLLAGDSDLKKPGLGKLVADSLGVLGTFTQRLGTAPAVAVNNVGAFTIKGDVVGANLSLGAAGTITIGGSFLGNATDGGNLELTSAKKVAIAGALVAVAGSDSGEIFASGDLLAVSIGLDVVGPAHISSNGKLGAVTIKGGVKSPASAGPVVISGVGAAVAPKAGLDTAIASLTIGQSAENLLVRAGYDAAGNPVSADAAIGKIMIGGDLRASSILVGAAAGPDGLFGTADDIKVSVTRDDARRVSTIASLIIKGQAIGTANSVSNVDLYAIVAEQITSAKIGGFAVKLTAGAHSLTDTFALGFLGSGPGNLPSDFYLHEISA